jgi:hypothetical protein
MPTDHLSLRLVDELDEHRRREPGDGARREPRPVAAATLGRPGGAPRRRHARFEVIRRREGPEDHLEPAAPSAFEVICWCARPEHHLDPAAATVTIWARLDRHHGERPEQGGVRTIDTRDEGEPAMRYLLLMNYAEPEPGAIPEEAIQETQDAFGAYGRALQEAGVLVAAEVLTSQASTTTLTLRGGSLDVQDGPFAETKEALAGVFVVDVPDLDAALGWAEKCPGAQFGVMEVRATTTSFIDGAWTASCPL